MSERIDNLQSITKFSSLALLSIGLHLCFLLYTQHLGQRYADTDMKDYVPVHMTIDMSPPIAEPQKKDLVVPVKPPVPKKMKAKKKANLSEKTIVAKPVPPVLGFPPDTLSKSPNGISVPVGNTTMAPDEGQRLKDVKALPTEQDLSTQPQLVRSSVEIPEYTREALDSNIEGTFTIDVYVDESGEVTKAELERKIGFGMDDKVLAAAKKVHFIPGKDHFGKEIAEWTQIKFRLQIP